jgi:Pilin accessory protein (PilO)
MILQLGKTRWYLGMQWNAFDTAPNFSEIKAEVVHYGANLYALRVSELAVQAGFAYDQNASLSKNSNKSYSLAARLASAVAEPWFGMFHLGNGVYWYIAVRDGYSILPDGDMVGTAEEIDEVRAAHAGFKDWKSVEGELDALNELLANIAQREGAGTVAKSKLVSVNAIGASKTLPWKGVAIGMVCAGLVGGGLYWQAVQKEEQARIYAAQVLATQQQKMVDQALAPLATPMPNSWLIACKEAVYALPLTKSGWKLVGIDCQNNEALAQWKLAPGATVKNRPEGVLSNDGNNISQLLPLSFGVSAGQNSPSIEPPGTLESNLLALRFIAQSTGMSLEITAPTDSAANTLPGQISQVAQQVSSSASQVKQLQKQSFVLISAAAPFSMDFSSIPGMRISKLSSSLVDSAGYKLEGMVYGY